MTNPEACIASGRRTVDLECRAIDALHNSIDNHFVNACQYMLACTGRVIVVGMGKSGHIGRKIAATLASTGTPSFFVHPAEASHGDMGMITRNDIVLALSHSGNTSEVVTLIPLLKRLGVPLISMTGNNTSTLACASDVHLDVSVDREACPLNLSPTSSTTVTLVMGDALAISLLEARGFTAEDFAFSHPGGTLGRRLLLKVSDIMRTGDRIPIVREGTSLVQTLMEITGKGLGITAICNDRQQIIGVFTDGDLRRTLDQNIDPRNCIIDDVMTRNCKTIQEHILAAEALHIMDECKINALICVDENRHVIGAVNMHDLLQAGVV